MRLNSSVRERLRRRDRRWEEEKERLYATVVKQLDFVAIEGLSHEALVNRLQLAVRGFVEQNIQLEFSGSAEQMMQEVVDELVGLGPLEPLLQDDDVSEIMVNGPDRVYVEKHGKIFLTEIKFHNERHVRRIIDRIVSWMGRRIDEGSPMVNARLPDGSRVHAVIPPITLHGSALTIRRFPHQPLGPEDLVRLGSLTEDMVTFLRAAVSGALNIIVSGGTGSGKTTLLNALSGFISPGERIITLEDSAELQLQQEHVVQMEARMPNIEGKGEITIRELLKNALRMRPDRIVVGECRGGEAFDMLQALNTGHDGSLTTLHANSPRDALSRLTSMVLMGGVDWPERFIRQQIASTVDLIVHLERLWDGSRRVTHITEIAGMEGDAVQMQDIYVFEGHSDTPGGKIEGCHKATGIQPKVADKLIARGQILPAFGPSQENSEHQEAERLEGG
ncbi:MAG: CpaF family protein [Nitrospinota bacterium]